VKLPQEVGEAGRRVSAASEAALPQALRGFLSSFVGKPYAIAHAAIEGAGGAKSESFAAVVFAAADGETAVPVGGLVPAARAAAVIDACEDLSLEGLRAAYGRMAAAKRLRQGVAAPPGGNAAQRDELLGVVLGLRSPLTLEAIALEMQQLNGEVPATEWPDMVAVVSTGLVQYSAQFPGENVTGDFFLPCTALAYAAPMYVVMVMKPSGEHTLNRVLAFVAAHLALFTPGADVPRFLEIVAGIPNNGVTLTGYQCNLAGQIVPVPRQFYNDRYLAQPPFTIDDGRGRTLATVRFLPWQDGGVILLRGEFPLEMLLVFLGPVAKNSSIVRRPGGQVSYAMPITETDFRKMLAEFGRRSNMVVRPDETNWVVKKFMDEGTSSPFIVRLLVGILKLRDAAFSEAKERDGFDTAYQLVTTPLLDARARMKKIAELWESHVRRVAAGEIVRVRGRTIHVDENIDSVLGHETDALLNAATRALKMGMPAVTDDLDVSIGFLFKKQPAFEAGLTALTVSHPVLADYLRETRAQWSETLVGRRNAVEHEGWRLPNVVYEQGGGVVRAREPLVDGLPVTAFAATMIDRLSCFAEEVTAHLLQRQLIAGVTITQVPLSERPAEAPERFRITLAVGGLEPWVLDYHASAFEDT